MGYYWENEKTLDTSGVFTTLKGCVGSAEGVSDREKTSLTVYAQTSQGDMIVGKTAEYIGDFSIWCFDFNDDWPFAKEI